VGRQRTGRSTRRVRGAALVVALVASVAPLATVVAQGGGASGVKTTDSTAVGKTNNMTITAPAAVGGTIASDSVPVLAPGAPGSVTAVKTAADSARDTAAINQRNRDLYPTTTTVNLDHIAAIVGDEPILWSDVIERINVERAQGLQVPTDSVGQIELARTVVNELINEDLLVQKAKDIKVEVTDDDVGPAVDDQIKRARASFQTEAEYRNALKQAGFGNAEEYRKTLVDQQKRQELQRKVIQKMK